MGVGVYLLVSVCGYVCWWVCECVLVRRGMAGWPAPGRAQMSESALARTRVVAELTALLAHVMSTW